MLSEQELEKSPLFHDISYQDYREILSCFQAVQRSFRADELIYDFSSDAVGVVERGQASLIRIDEEGVATVLEDLGVMKPPQEPEQEAPAPEDNPPEAPPIEEPAEPEPVLLNEGAGGQLTLF